MKENPDRDEKLRDAIIAVLHKAYRNPKGKYQHVTSPILFRDVKDIIDCEREEIKREIDFLEKNNQIDTESVRYPLRKVGSMRFDAGSTKYYTLSAGILNRLEQHSKYSSDNWTQKSTNVIKIENSTINAPITAGQQIVVSHNPQFDLENIVDLIEQNVSVQQKEQVTTIIKENLPNLLENPNPKGLGVLVDKIKKTGQTWLVPVITQLAASYFAFKLGLN